MGKNRFLLFVLMLTGFLQAFAGEGNRYMVFFTDKAGSTYTLENPQSFLSERALNRREKQNISINENDLPVSSTYVSTLAEMDSVHVFFATKWLNGVLVETTTSQIEIINLQPFVKHVEYVAPGYKLSVDGKNGRNSRNSNNFKSGSMDDDSEAQNTMIGVNEMHEAGYRGEGMLIAVFDSGFETVNQSTFYTHIFDRDKIVGEKDFVKNSGNVFQYDNHGSKVLSCISAYKTGNYSGAAPEADLVLCVTEDISAEYRIEEYNWLFAAEYADSIGVDIINSSVGYSYFSDESMDYTYADLDGKTAVISRAATRAASKGMLVVASNGNEGNNSWTYLNAPADADSVLSVGAVTFDEIKSNFSSYGPSSDGRIKPEVSAPGSWVRVVYRNEIVYANGTSFSTPLASGLAAGFWQAFPELTNMEVMEYLKLSSSQANSPDTLIGYGIPNFVRAFNQAKINEGNIESKFIVFPNPVTNERIIYLYNESTQHGAVATISFYDLKGSEISTKSISVNSQKQLLEIDVSFLVPGTYILNYLSGIEKRKIKLVVL